MHNQPREPQPQLKEPVIETCNAFIELNTNRWRDFIDPAEEMYQIMCFVTHIRAVSSAFA